MSRTSTPPRARSSRRRGLRASLILGLALVLSGCLKYDLTLVVSQDDTLDGTLIVAVAREFAVGQDVFGRSGELTPSQGSVTKEAYEDADYVGSRYVISGVPISEIDALSSDSSIRFALTREGDDYLLDASLDFNLAGPDTVPTGNSFTAMVSMTFPGAVTESNGTIQGNTVAWTQLRPDAENTLTARASAIANGEAGSASDSGIAWWVWVLGGIGLLLVATLVTGLLLGRRRAATSARAAQAESATHEWPGQPEGYEGSGSWAPQGGQGPQSGYYDSDQGDGYDSYYGMPEGTYGDPYSGQSYPHDSDGESSGTSYGGAYGGPPGTLPYPQAAPPHDDNSGQPVVGAPDSSAPHGGSPKPTT
ncbi:MAG: LppM family (lipo)protein [Geodermatophilaceae bacterium]